MYLYELYIFCSYVLLRNIFTLRYHPSTQNQADFIILVILSQESWDDKSLLVSATQFFLSLNG